MLKRFLPGLLALCVLASSGCLAVAVGAGAGAGTYAYVKGVTEVTYNAPYNDVWRAAGDSLRHFDIRISSQNRDALAGSYKGERHDGTNVIIDVESASRNKTRVAVRVGAFGDRELQETIADDIRNRL